MEKQSKTKIILGIDEVGRGPWAGPLVVGAVILGESFASQTNRYGSQLSNPEKSSNNPKSQPETLTSHEKSELYHNLTDSKQLSAKKRTELAPLIYKYATAAATGWVSARELDQYGLSTSLKLATRRAVKRILTNKLQFTEIIIDGTINLLKDTPLEDRVTLLKKADSLIKEVSAASIIAKVARDEYMIKLAAEYPEYGFASHVGYGTAKHRAALEKNGICPEHRLSFRPVALIAKAQSDRTISPKRPENASKPPKITESPQIAKKTNLENRINVLKPAYQAQNTTSKGHYAETLVAEYLKSLNHAIVAQNFKTKSYEIDLISTKNDKIYFTEVKYRKNPHHGSALNQITGQKLDQMHYAAQKFMSSEQNLIQECLQQNTIAHENPTTLQPLLAVASVSGADFLIDDWFVLT